MSAESVTGCGRTMPTHLGGSYTTTAGFAANPDGSNPTSCSRLPPAALCLLRLN